MVEAARRIVEEGRPHAGVELLFTPKEEIGLVGADAFDVARLEARLGFVYDQAAPIGEVVVGAPYGAGARASRSRARRARRHVPGGGPLGDRRRPRARSPTCGSAGSTRRRRANVGLDRAAAPRATSSPSGARSRPRRARTTTRKLAEVVQEMLDACAFAASVSDCDGRDARSSAKYRGYRFARRRPAVRLAVDGARAQRASSRGSALSGGGADANVFNARGLPCVNLANGMADIHTPDEHIAVADLERWST